MRPSSGPPEAGASATGERLLVGALAVAFALGGTLWAAGELSGRMASGAWPGLRPSQMGGVLVRLLGTPGDPAAAWPASAAKRVPGPAAFWVAALALWVVLGLLAALVVRLTRRLRPAREEGPARWATPGDLARLRVRRPVPGRLTLGRAGRTLVAAEPGVSVLVVGPTQTMKTSGLAVPAILEWEGPLIATSVKSDLARHTAGWRERQGPVWVYDPSGQSGLAAAGWSPLAAAGTWGGAQRVAEWLTVAARPSTAGLQDAGFWSAAAAKLLAPLLLAAACSGRDMADVVRWLDTNEQAEVLLALARTGVAEAEAAAIASFSREERQRSGIYTTAETVLAAFADPAVAASARRSDVDPETLLEQEGSLYLCAPAHEQRRLRPLFVALLEHALATAFTRAASGPLDPPLLVVLDEAANIAPLPGLDELAATAAGHGIQLVTVFHDLAQVIARYGERAASVVNNHRARLVLSGVADPETLRQLSQLAGDAEVRTASETRDGAGRRSRTEASARRPLVTPAGLRAIRPGQGVLIYGHLPPARLSLRPWFRERELRARAGVRFEGSAMPAHVEEAQAVTRVPPPPSESGPGHGDPDVGDIDGATAMQDRPAPVAAEATTAAQAVGPAVAARLLGISRPGVYDLWERGELPVIEVWDPGRGMRPRVPLEAIARRTGVGVNELERCLRAPSRRDGPGSASG